MKYVIKELNILNPAYLKTHLLRFHSHRGMRQDEDYSQGLLVPDLASATQFSVIEDAVAAIVWHSRYSNARYTIVGIKEINQPRYEEVAL